MAKRKSRSFAVNMKIDEFELFMKEKGYVKVATGSEWEVLRMTNPEIDGDMRTIMVYKRKNGLLSIPETLVGLYKEFDLWREK